MPPVKDPFGIVAKRWSITPEYLHTLFRKKQDIAPGNFSHGRSSILHSIFPVNSGLPISEIALRCGFFSRQSGMSPGACRKMRDDIKGASDKG